MKPLLLLALLAVVACAPEPSGLSPDQTRDAFDAALEAGETDAALDMLRDAAPTDLMAHAMLGEAYQRGYLSIRDTLGGPDTNFPIRAWPGQAALEGWRFERHVDRAARVGEPFALLVVAWRIIEPHEILNGEFVEPDLTPAQRDSAKAIYRQLVDTDVDRFRLGLLAQSLGDTVAHRRHIAEAAAQGDPTACTFMVWFLESDPQTTTAHTEGMALYFDRVADCRPGHPIPYRAADSLRDLQAQIDLGNPASIAVLDSLRQLGVFDRHPELAALVAVGPPASIRSPVPTASAAP